MGMGSQKELEVFLKLVQRNDLDGVKTFLTHAESQGTSIDVNITCRKATGDTAMHVASQEGHLDMLRYLTEERAGRLEVVNLDGKTALHNAAHFSHVELVKYLLQRGANVQAVKKADWTPLMLACTKDNLEVIQILLDHGSDPKFQNKDGWNSLHIAARVGHLPVITALLSHSDADHLLLMKSKNGRTPLHTAVMHGHKTVVDLLLQRASLLDPAQVDIRDSCQTTLVMDAYRFGLCDILTLLTDKYKADVTLENSLGMNCLHIAAEAGQIPIIISLVVKHHLDVNKPTKSQGLTPLHFACRENHVDTVRLLLGMGACPNIRDVYRHSCFDLSRTLKKTDVLRLLHSKSEETS